MTSVFVLLSGGERVTARGSTYDLKTDGNHVSTACSAMEEEFWGGDTTPLHSHAGAEEAFFVPGGAAEVWADGHVSEATTGAFIVVPRGVPQVAAQGVEQLLADPDRLLALAAEYGTEILGDHPARPH
jgi:mannose-6-phosphate isomerase-like protein (cupin superfamily)